MNLTNNCDLSIGTDLISKLGIGFDCKRSYDDFSELLTEADRELSDYENVLQCHKVAQDQIDEWLENGVIKRAPAKTEWNSALTVVKKTNAKGVITGYRVCHDPRHINALLKPIDRMPLPKISEIFEELKGASVYSTLVLKSAFNSLKIRDDHAHKLALL
ncbi:hypothetical protein G6F68_007714 [Rhizopus microsporus]|nr:hypothetical protein G6F67_008107 [Rhizopus microsporus]KAG1260038.1 hypothetical protein G6F68_007714 [Rhizopus microsporus]